MILNFQVVGTCFSFHIDSQKIGYSVRNHGMILVEKTR